MHRLLKRQLKRHIGKESDIDSLDPKIQKFFDVVSEVYDSFDEQRRMQEHIITVSSEELRNSNEKLQELLDKNSELLKNKTDENKDIINILHQYKHAIDQSLIVSRANKEGIITYANDKFCQISGYSRDELIGSSHNIVRNPANPKSIFEELWDTITKKEVWHGTISNRKKSGELYYVKSTIVPILDLDGEIHEYIALRDDITKEFLYQERLQDQKENLDTIFNAQENILIIIDPNSGVVNANSRFYETFGFKDLEDFNSSVDCICKLFNEEDELTNSQCNNKKWYEKYLNANDEQRNITRQDENNQEQIFRVSCQDIKLQGQQHFLITFVDITELENARKKAEIARETKSNFLANMSHEIRTPLNAIIGFSDLLKTKKLEGDEKGYANIISNSAESLLDIINDVLDISKIESGKLIIEKEAFPINVFIDNIVELFSVKAREKKIRFIYDADPNVPYSVITDATRLRQVISNLLSNAIKFTDTYGHVNFKLSLVEKTQNTAKIEFLIKDNGIGISKEQQQDIFEPFSQADSGISRKYGGTGLGLSICKDIITMLGSKIDLISQEGIGSMFKFTLEVEVDKFIDERDHHYTDNSFAITDIANDDEHLRSNIVNYLSKIGRVYEFSEDSIYKHIDILFCFSNKNLNRTVNRFKELNPDAKIVFVGEQENLELFEVEKHITNHIDLPIYGSKIFNIISDNDHKIIETLEKDTQNDEKEYSKHILVAEDNPNNQKLIEILLENMNIKCSIAEDGVEAISMYEQNKYDLVFMDINMPRLDGVAATQEIMRKQKDEGLYKIPIIALTANSLEGDKEKYILAGMDDYISKPIVQNKLKDVINKYTNIIKKEADTIELKEESVQVYEEVIEPKQNEDISITFDKSKAVKTLNLSENVVDMLIKQFFLTLPKDIEKLEDFVEQNEYDEIKKQAHYIKGSAANLSMKDIVNILEDMENKSQNQKCDIADIEKIKLIAQKIEESI